MFFSCHTGGLALKLTADGHGGVTALLSGQPWLMLNKSCRNCQVQRIHSENRLWIECIIVSRTVPQGGRGALLLSMMSKQMMNHLIFIVSL